MKNVKKSWIALLLGGLLAATLVGVVWARPKSHHGGFHYTVTIPGAHFHPIQDGYDWYNAGSVIRVHSGQGSFYAAVPMLPGNRTVESMTMYVKDDHASFNAVAKLYRTKTDGTQQEMAAVNSTGSSSSIRTFSDTTVSPSTVWGGHGAYIWLEIWSTNIDVYSIQIKYY